MANFNPEIQPQNAPEYQFGQPTGKYESHWQYIPTENVSNFKGDSSAGVALEGLGNLIKQGTAVADQMVKTVIDDAIENGVDKNREGFTGALEQIGGVPQTQRVASYTPDAPPTTTGIDTSATDILPGATAAPIPAGLNQGVNSASTLTNGAVNGKLSPTYYYGRLDLLSKDLRSQYPGYRDYIDTKISSMTGGNPANEYMKALLTNINQNMTNNRSETEKALGIIASNSGVEGAVNESRILSSGVANPMAHVIGWLHDWTAVDVKNKRALEEISLFKGQNDQKVTLAKQNASNVSTDVFNNIWKETIQGLGKSWDDISKMSTDDIQKLSGGSDANGQQLAQSITLAENNARVAVQKRLNEKGPDGKSFADYLGPQETQALVDSTVKPFSSVAQAFTNKDFGAAHYNANFVTSKIKDSNAWLLKDSSIKDAAAMYSSVSSLLGPAAAGYLVSTGGVLGNLDDVVKQYTNYNKLKLMTDPNTTLTTIVDDMKAKGVGDPNDPIKKTQVPAYQAITEIPKLIADPKIPDNGKTILIQKSFSPDNNTLIPKFADDTFDSKGNLIPGKHTILRNMTSPQITSEVYRLSQNNPQLWDTYKSWVDRTTNDLIRNDVQGMSELEMNPNLAITWDTDKHQFGIQFKSSFYNTPFDKGSTPSPIQVTLANSYKQTIAKINAAIQPKINVATKEGSDVNASLMNYMVNGLHLDPSGVGMPSELMKALVGPQQTPDKKSENTPSGTNLNAPSFATAPGSAFNEAVTRVGKSMLPQIPELTDYAQKSDTTTLHDTVKQAESNGNYDSLFGSNSKIPLSHMNIGEVMALQKHYTDMGSESSAAGAYQFLRKTVQGLIKNGVVSPTDIFNKDTQDKMATALMERRGLSDFKSGKISKEQFIDNLAKEWAGLPTTNGQSYYQGVGSNHATVKLPQVFASLAGLK